MRPLRFLGVVLAAAAMTLAAIGAASAQVAMPDASAMSGVPLPAGDLPNGTVTVRVVRERMGNNLPGQVVTLAGGGQTKTATTDDQGRAEFTGFPEGTPVRASVVVDGESLSSEAFPVPGRGGVRVALVAGASAAAAAEQAAAAAAAKEPPRQGIVEFGGDTRFIIEYQDDRLQVFYLLDIMNNARTPIDIGGPLLMELPPGAAGATVLEGSSIQASTRGELLTVTGPFAPGKTVVQVGFTMPDVGTTLQIRQKMPAALAQTFVAVEKLGSMRLSSPQLAEVRDMNADGQTFMMGTGGRVNAGETLALDVTGLPAHSTTSRTAALALAVVILLVGGWMAFGPRDPAADSDARLKAKHDKLMSELVGLERKRKTHPLTTGEEARRQKLVADLERALAALDHGPSPGGEGVAA